MPPYPHISCASYMKSLARLAKFAFDVCISLLVYTYQVRLPTPSTFVLLLVLIKRRHQKILLLGRVAHAHQFAFDAANAAEPITSTLESVILRTNSRIIHVPKEGGATL